MDEPQANQPLPQPPPNNKTPHPLSFLQEVEWSVGGLFLGLLFFAAVFLTLNYFNILTLSKLYPNIFGMLPHKPYAQKQAPLHTIEVNLTPTPAPTTSAPVKQFSFGCPVAKEFCNSGKIATYQGEPALIYHLTATASSKILSSTDILDNQHMDTAQNPTLKTQALYVAVKTPENSCYTLRYVVPSDAIYLNPTQFPIAQGGFLFQLGSQTITVGSAEANVIFMARKMTDPNNPCTIKGNDKKEDGPYVPIESLNINFNP